MPPSTAAPPYAAAAMAAAAEGPGALLPVSFLQQPLFIHGVGAGAHVLLALAVAGRLLLRRCVRGRAGAKDGDGASPRPAASRCYGVAACATWALAAFHALLAAYACYLGAGAGWSRDAAAELADAAARAVAWLLLAAYIQFGFGRRRDERFPAPLRLWWALFLLLSVLAAAAHVATSLGGLPVPARSWALDAVSVVAAAVLLCAGFLGGRVGGGSAAEEPLLNGAHGAAVGSGRTAAEASMFTSAGFLSVLKFGFGRRCD